MLARQTASISHSPVTKTFETQGFFFPSNSWLILETKTLCRTNQIILKSGLSGELYKHVTPKQTLKSIGYILQVLFCFLAMMQSMQDVHT